MFLKRASRAESRQLAAETRISIVQPAGLERDLDLSEDPVSIGRDASCGLQLDFPDVSRLHARLLRQGEGWLVEDCGSRNGILVNGERVGKRDLVDGDLIKIGGVTLRFQGLRNSLPATELSHIRKLLEVSRAISSSLVPEEVLQKIIDSVAEISGAERAFLMLVDTNGNLELKAARNIERWAIESSSFQISRSVADEAARNRRPVVIDRVPEGGATKSIEALGLKAIACIPLILKDRVIGVLYTDSRQPSWIKELDVQILESLASHAAVAIENARLNQEQKEAFFNTSMALAEAVDARDRYTAGHSRRVTDYSLMIGRAMGLSLAELDFLRIGSILHDIGKIGIEDCVLRKPAKLDDDEYAEIRQHPEIGARILMHVPQLAQVVPAVRSHHERVDGKGYPDGLSGEQIPLLARIIAVADAFDAMTSTRVYRRRLPVSHAIQELQEGRGTQFDARVVDVFLKICSEDQEVLRQAEEIQEETELPNPSMLGPDFMVTTLQ